MVVIIRGGGDIASGTIHCLHNVGFKVLVLETQNPTSIRRQVSFSEAVYNGETTVENVKARKINHSSEAESLWAEGQIPVLVDPLCSSLLQISCGVLVDAILAKKNLGTNRKMAPMTIALGPGFEAGADVDLVIETNRGHNLGRIIYSGFAEPNTGVPGEIGGQSTLRVHYSLSDGVFQHCAQIGNLVNEGDVIAHVDSTPIKAQVNGFIRGLFRDGQEVSKGLKIADIDPRSKEAINCFTISDKARNIAGSVLEAILYLEKKMENELLFILSEEVHKGHNVVLVSVVESLGSSPAKMGAMMVCCQDETIHGTVGGGAIEAKLIRHAKQALIDGQDSFLDVKLNDKDVAMSCGGAAKFFIKCFKPEPKLLIVGGGHIGHALYKLAAQMAFNIIVFDEREEFISEERFPLAERLQEWEKLAQYDTDINTYIVIVGKGHVVDTKALEILITKKYKYIGLIGSKNKIQTVFEHLKKQNISSELLDKVFAPIGINLSRTAPVEIALGILCEIVMVKNNVELSHNKSF